MSEDKDALIYLADMRIDQLEAENAELRELVADMFKAMKHVEDSAGMDVMVAYSPWFAPKLRELGLEVDG